MKVIEIGKGKNFHSCWENNGRRFTSDFKYSYNPHDTFKAFTYQGIDYEYDKNTNRYYYLSESDNIRPEMDGAMVRRRIGKTRYMEIYEQLIEYLGMNEEDTEETSESEEPKTETTETTETATEDTADQDDTTDSEVGKFVYDVVIHNFYGCDTYTVRADGLESAKDKALNIMKNESLDEDYYSIDSIRIYAENSEELLKEIIFEPTEAEATNPVEINNKKSEINSMYGITANSPDIYNEYNETKELLAVDHFERLTGTLFKSLFKAIGLEETRRIPIIISNNMVYFNYNGKQYKYNPAQCKVYKKSGRRYLRINWKDFTDDNSPTDQKQARGRSPPFTPDIRSSTIQ